MKKTAQREFFYFTLKACKRQRGKAVYAAATTSAPSAPPRYSTQPPAGGSKYGGKTVVITGGSQGIGRAGAQRFSREGFNVVIAARNPALVEAAAEELAAAPSARGRAGASLGVPTDITDEADVARLVERVAGTYSSVDVVVNCAGVCVTGSLSETPLAVFREQLDVNFLGAVAVTQGFQPALVAAAQRGAKPVLANVNSFVGKIPARQMPAYTASKFALAGWTDSIRPELADLGIHVAQIYPGVVRSNFLERAGFLGEGGPARRKQMEEMLSSGGGGIVQTPEQVGDAIWNAVAQRKDEVSVGLPFQLLGAMYKTFNINPLSMPV
ncbi:hypothetical protein WJX81_007664 [Elliptochloris bilobata]|uniref:Uncharacterized protein n=1 Tax=Elliptochloris bilobata TaxID=381761 RepID=A0AAW1RNK7_9CHLO